MTPTLTPFADQSEACDVPYGAPLALHCPGGAPADGRITGVAEAIRELRVDARARVSEVTLGAGAAARIVVVTVPAAATLPLACGEVATIVLRQRVLGIHLTLDASLSVAGELRLARSESGEPSWAPGWAIEVATIVGPPPPPRANGTAERLDLPVCFARGGRRAAIAGNAWRRLGIGGESWLLSGHAVAWGPGNLVPDSSTYSVYSILRER